MKEHYLKKNKFLLGENIRGGEKPFHIQKEDMLLICDMQNFFTDSSSPAFIPDSGYIIPIINSTAEKMKSMNCPVILTKHSNNDDNAGMMKHTYRYMIDINKSEYEIDRRLNTKESIIIEKHQFDAFYETALKKLISSNNTKRLILMGVMLERCVESTARSSFVHGIQPVIIADGSATKNMSMHMCSIKSMSSAGIKIIMSERVVIDE